MKKCHPLNPSKRQAGAVLAVGLLLLLVMTLIGVTAMNSIIMEEKMAGNYRDRHLALQAAESALRDAENDIQCDSCTRPLQISGLAGFDTSCTNGLCYGAGMPDASTHLLAGNGIAYGTYTSATGLSAVNMPPRYLIEGYKYYGAGAASWKYMYKITAVGYGGSSEAKVLLQSGFR